MRQGDRRFERIADRVGKEAAAAEPTARLQFPGAERVHENKNAELFGFGPDGVKFRVGQFLPGNAAADPEAAQPQSLDRVFELLDRELRVLQSNRRKGDKTVGHRGAELCQLFILKLDQLGRSVAIGAVPERVDAERFDIDALGVHLGDAVGKVRPQQPWGFERMIDHRRRFRNNGVGVDVDRFDSLAADHDLAPAPSLWSARTACREAASNAREPGQRTGNQLPRNRHTTSSWINFLSRAYYGSI